MSSTLGSLYIEYVIIGHLGVTIGYLRVTIAPLKITIAPLKITIGHLRVFLYSSFLFFLSSKLKANATELHHKVRPTCLALRRVRLHSSERFHPGFRFPLSPTFNFPQKIPKRQNGVTGRKQRYSTPSSSSLYSRSHPSFCVYKTDAARNLSTSRLKVHYLQSFLEGYLFA